MPGGAGAALTIPVTCPIIHRSKRVVLRYISHSTLSDKVDLPSLDPGTVLRKYQGIMTT